jgi:hypothetical protein
MKLTNAVCMMVLVLWFAAPPATAAEQHPMTEAQGQALLHTLSILGRHQRRDLFQMAMALSGVEHDAALEIVSSATEASNAVEDLLTLTMIYPRMACAADRAELLSWLPGSLRNAKGALDLDIDAINGMLPQLTNPAALSEAQAIRDKLHEVREQLNQYNY